MAAARRTILWAPSLVISESNKAAETVAPGIPENIAQIGPQQQSFRKSILLAGIRLLSLKTLCYHGTGVGSPAPMNWPGTVCIGMDAPTE